MNPINERLAALPAILGYESPAALAKASGLDPNTYRKAMQGPSKPGYDLLAALLDKQPRVSPDWLLLGVGPQLRDGRVLTPVAVEETTPARQYGSLTAQAGGQQRDELVQQLRHQLADQANTIERLWKQNDILLDRKPEASAEAADLYLETDRIAAEYAARTADLPELHPFRPTPVVRTLMGFGRPAA